ncbi:MAG: hypothetical protein AAGB22_03505 [Bacteroidota bacterium]
MNYSSRPKVLITIAVLTGLTIPRAQGLLFLPTLEMVGGSSPDAWLAPWVTDAILGLLVPVVIYALLKKTGASTWGLILVYSAIGAFDHANGMVTEWLTPLPVETAGPALVFGSLIATISFQLAAIVLLFRKDVRAYFMAANNA